MFNSFLDGTKSALEMAAVANSCNLSPPTDGLEFPPCGAHHLPTVLRPREAGGHLEKKGTVEVVSSLELDGRQVFNDIRFGVFVVIEGEMRLIQSPTIFLLIFLSSGRAVPKRLLQAIRPANRLHGQICCAVQTLPSYWARTWRFHRNDNVSW